jgi:hypothetical protein
MSRSYDPREPQELREGVTAPPENPNVPEQEERPAEQFPEDPRRESRSPSRSRTPREIYEVRGRTFRVRHSEVEAMIAIGTFRAIAQEDLIEFLYGGDNMRFRPDVENLVRQGLVELKSIPHEEKGSRTLLTLTKQGHRFLTNTQVALEGQALYYGFAKSREAHHDADLYRLYQKAAEKLERQGSKKLRVVLDYELKKRVYHDLAKLGKKRTSPTHQREVAERHGLRLVRGKIPLPDLRIEHQTRDGEKGRVDVELATHHYRARNLAEKVLAGFSIYAREDEASKLRRVLDQRELTAEILSL